MEPANSVNGNKKNDSLSQILSYVASSSSDSEPEDAQPTKGSENQHVPVSSDQKPIDHQEGSTDITSTIKVENTSESRITVPIIVSDCSENGSVVSLGSDTSSTSEDEEEEEAVAVDSTRTSGEKKKGKYPVIKARGELSIDDLPPIEDLKITVKEEDCERFGRVMSIVDKLVVIESLPSIPALNVDSVIFKKSGEPLGQVFDVFGPVTKPFYVLRYNSREDIRSRGIQIDYLVYYSPRSQHSQFVFIPELTRLKGSDASWVGDIEPPPEHLDFSDDEEERRVKSVIKAERLGSRRTMSTDSEEGPSSKMMTFEEKMNQKNTLRNQMFRLKDGCGDGRRKERGEPWHRVSLRSPTIGPPSDNSPGFMRPPHLSAPVWTPPSPAPRLRWTPPPPFSPTSRPPPPLFTPLHSTSSSHFPTPPPFSAQYLPINNRRPVFKPNISSPPSPSGGFSPPFSSQSSNSNLFQFSSSFSSPSQYHRPPNPASLQYPENTSFSQQFGPSSPSFGPMSPPFSRPPCRPPPQSGPNSSMFHRPCAPFPPQGGSPSLHFPRPCGPPGNAPFPQHNGSNNPPFSPQSRPTNPFSLRNDFSSCPFPPPKWN